METIEERLKEVRSNVDEVEVAENHETKVELRMPNRPTNIQL